MVGCFVPCGVGCFDEMGEGGKNGTVECVGFAVLDGRLDLKVVDVGYGVGASWKASSLLI